MKIKRFVSTILLFVLVVMVPLETLSQLEPEVTYGDWCTHLAELHAELHAQQEARVLQVGPLLWGTLALSAGVCCFKEADIEDYLADCADECWYWNYVSSGDAYRGIGSLLLVVAGVIYVQYWRYLVQRAHEIKALYGERTTADVLREIELWEQAGAARMWFYPCE